jgi:putative NAD(P)-binding protein
MMRSNRTVTVFGAYGHTGRFVVSELRKRGWTPILCGRDATKLKGIGDAHPELEVRVASVDDPASLDRAISGAVAVNTGRRYIFSNNGLERADPPPARVWNFPSPIGSQDVVGLPLAETITISRHLRTAEIRPYINLAPLFDLRNPDTPAPAPADESGRSSQTFLVDVIVRRGNEEHRATARGRDIYAVTAPIVVEATERILDHRITRAGVAAAGEIFDAQDFLNSLCPEHLSFVVM